MDERELLYAIRQRNLQRVKYLMDCHGLHGNQSHGYVFLREATECNCTEITKVLLEHGASVQSKRSKVSPSDTPLHFAVAKRNKEIVKMLLDYNADINAKNGSNWVPLQTAVKQNDEFLVDLLCRRGASLNTYNFPSPLHIAVSEGLYPMTRKLLELGAEVNPIISSRYEFTPLHCAVKAPKCFRNPLIVELLIENGANIGFKTAEEQTALHLASINGDVEIIRLLLNNGADVNVYDSNLLTPLHLSIENYHTEAAKYLMDHGANVDAESKDGKTSLYIAVCKQLSSTVEDILIFCPDVNNESNRNCLKIAAKQSNSEGIVKKLIQYGFSLEPSDINDIDLLRNAVRLGYIEIIEDLLKLGLNLNCDKEEISTILHIATKYKHIDIAKLLLVHGADVNAIDNTGKPAIFYSTENLDINMTKLLLCHGACVSKYQELLRIATNKVCKELVEILIQAGIDVNATDRNGKTALHLTAFSGYDEFFSRYMDYFSKDKSTLDNDEKTEMAKLLLSMGANVDAKTDKDKLTTLHYACKKNLKDIVKVLLDYKANVNCPVKDFSPLLIAAHEGNAAIMKMLIGKGANVHIRRENGDTALHVAAKNGDTDAVQVLLDNGADVHAKNNEDEIALHEASKQNNPKIVEILLQQGSRINSKNKKGNTPLHLAVLASQTKIVEVLLESGSDINITSDQLLTAADLELNSWISPKFRYTEMYESEDEFSDFAVEARYNISDKLCDILQFHLIKLKTAKLYVSKNNEELIKKNLKNMHFENDCEDEIKELKLEKISCDTSLYDILTKNVIYFAAYARNKDIIRAFEPNSFTNYKTKFPIYASLIKTNFENGFHRHLLLEKAQERLYCFWELPYDCSFQIFKYLDNSDLENISKT